MNNSSSITAGDPLRPNLVNAKKVMNFEELSSAKKDPSGFTDNIIGTESLIN